MSMPIGPQQQQTPSITTNQEAYSTDPSRGSFGPVIAVLVVIIILGVVAGMIGRFCSGRRIMGHYRYYLAGWVKTKCASCIDGRIDPPPPRPPGDSVPVAIPIEIPQETKRTQQSTENPPAASNS
ncbi:hypothetical protein NE237_023907 [Protea cynaroides]|uniref:Uncharacterized protein n=1 Tax=Protea cynaroides TaxID=273540 RepID=A0A9Q0HFU5_9MAGN|nr:hypothetical protein NE237_023907 [Protea cynaroides]